MDRTATPKASVVITVSDVTIVEILTMYDVLNHSFLRVRMNLRTPTNGDTAGESSAPSPQQKRSGAPTIGGPDDWLESKATGTAAEKLVAKSTESRTADLLRR